MSENEVRTIYVQATKKTRDGGLYIQAIINDSHKIKECEFSDEFDIVNSFGKKGFKLQVMTVLLNDGTDHITEFYFQK